MLKKVFEPCIICTERKVRGMTLGTRIKQLRKEQNMSQADLANATGLKKSAISMYELDAREPNIETLEILADHFNVDMNYLIGRSSTTGLILQEDERLLVIQYRALSAEGKAKISGYMADLMASGRYNG